MFALCVSLLTTLLLLSCSRRPEYAAGEKRVMTVSGLTFNLVYVPSESKNTRKADIGCWVGDSLVSYTLWETVRVWAVDPARGENRYTFANSGKKETPYSIEGDPTEKLYTPVIAVNWRDALVWMNAFTEWYNAENGENLPDLSPAYYADQGFSQILRHSDNSPVSETIPPGGLDDPYVKPSADGFRLPSTAIWESASGLESSEYDEDFNPIRNWLFPDLDGPNSEWCFDWEPGFIGVGRSWRGGGYALRSVPCVCAISPPTRAMAPDRVFSMMGVRFCFYLDNKNKN